MKVDVKTYKIVCDGCGRTFTSANDEVCYVDYPDGITDMCRDSDWLITAPTATSSTIVTAGKQRTVNSMPTMENQLITDL